MTHYRKKPIEVEAVRYGKDADGSWYPGAVQRVASFMLGLGPDGEPTEAQCCDVLSPVGAWDPPDSADLEMWDGVAHHAWLPLALGDYVIRGVDGEFYPCAPDIFTATYDPVLSDTKGEAQ